MSVKIAVAHGIKEEMFQFIDQGKARTLQDILSVEDWVNPREVSVTMKMLWRRDRTAHNNPYAHAGSFNESEGVIYDWVLTVKPEIKEEWENVRPKMNAAYSGTMRCIPVSLLYYLYHVWHEENYEFCDRFFNVFITGKTSCPGDEVIHRALRKAQKLKLDAQTGKFVQGKQRHADLKEAMLEVLLFAWESVDEDRVITTDVQFNKAFNRHVKEKTALTT
jgi:hypothetical protein